MLAAIVINVKRRFNNNHVPCKSGLVFDGTRAGSTVSWTALSRYAVISYIS
jgi:hypothetical protein